MNRRRLPSLLACSAVAAAAAALLLGAGPAPFAGQFSDGSLTVDLAPAADGVGYAGRITRGQQSFAATAMADSDGLRGQFAAGGQSFAFTEAVQGDAATFVTGQRTYALRRVGPATAVDTHVWHLKRTTLTDAFMAQHQGEPGPDALTLLVPDGWTAQCHATMPIRHDVNFTGPRLFISVADPVGTTGVRIVPGHPTFWSDDARVRQVIQGIDQQSPLTLRDPLVPTRPWDAAISKLAVNPTGMLGGPRAIGEPELVPGAAVALAPVLRRANTSLAEAARQAGTAAPTVAADAARQRVTGTLDGRPVEGWFVLLLTTRSDPVPGTRATVAVQDAPLIALMYAPPGQLDANEKLLSNLMDSIQVDPEWQRLTQQFVNDQRAKIDAMNASTQQQIAAINNEIIDDNAASAAHRQAMILGAASYSADVHASIAAHRAAALDHCDQQFGLYAGDQAVYRDPATGGRFQMTSTYGHVWGSTTGNNTDFIFSDSPSLDPNGRVGNGTWREYQPEH